MVQKKSASVKTTAKSPSKTKTVETKTIAKKAIVVETGLNSKSPGAKPSSFSASSSRAKIAAVAARRARSSTTASSTNKVKEELNEVQSKSKSGSKIVAAAVVKPVTKKSTPIAETEIEKTKETSSKSKHLIGDRYGFKTKEYVVYPAHGVGQIVDFEEQEIAGLPLELFVITFEKDKMTLRVPTDKFKSGGMRKISNPDVVEKAINTLKGRARIKRTMWSRRAQEYEAKINSGDLIAIAEVVRDLYRSENQPDQSYSERQLYEHALDRMAREIAVVEKLDERGSIQRITDVLAKSAKGRQAEEENAQESESSSDVEAA